MMKKIYLFVVLAVVSIVLTSCLSTMVDIASSTYPSLMLSSPDGTSRLVWDFKAKTMTIDDPETLEVKKEWKGASAGSVKSFAFSQDSRYMVFVSEGKVKIWDFKNNTMHKELTTEGTPASAVFSRDNKYVSVLDYKGMSSFLNIFELENGRQLWRQKTDDGITRFMDFNKDSKLIATGGFKGIQIFSVSNPSSNKIINLFKSEAVDSIEYSSSGKYLAVSIKKENPEVRLWDVSSGEPKLKCQLVGHTNRIQGEGIIFNYNEKYLATGAGDLTETDPTKRFEAIIWEINTCRKIRTIQEFTAIGASPDGRFFAWDKDLNRMKTFFWGGEWIHDITGKNMFLSVNELINNLTGDIPEGKKPTIAITNFAPISISPTSLEQFLSEEFITRMILTQRFRVVERSQIQKVMDELKLSVSDLVDPNQSAKVGKLLGADYLLVGSVTDEKFGLKVNARIINTETAEVLKASSTTIVKDPMVKNLLDDRT